MNADLCNICKQPFNQQRNVNRHHWYYIIFILVGYVLRRFADSAVAKRLIMRDRAIFVF